MRWHPQQILEVALLAGQKWPASKIATQFGVSRNAIIGLCHRNDIELNTPLARRTRTGKPIMRAVVRKPAPVKPRKVKAKPEALNVVAPTLGAMPFEPRAADVESERLLLRELKAESCRWPDEERDGATGQYTFCGHSKMAGSNYCADHYAISIGPGTQSERSAIKDARHATRAA